MEEKVKTRMERGNGKNACQVRHQIKEKPHLAGVAKQLRSHEDEVISCFSPFTFHVHRYSTTTGFLDVYVGEGLRQNA